MPYEPELGLRARSFQWLSLVHIGTRQDIWSMPKPHSGRIAQASAWLPLNPTQEVGTGIAGVVGRAEPRLAACCLRAASSAARAWSAAACAAAVALAWASAWAARCGALTNC